MPGSQPARHRRGAAGDAAAAVGLWGRAVGCGWAGGSTRRVVAACGADRGPRAVSISDSIESADGGAVMVAGATVSTRPRNIDDQLGVEEGGDR
jgi:hypothetical protein